MAVAGLTLGGAGTSLALDPASTQKPASNPWDALRKGMDAYRSGHKDEAVEAYRYAAEKGQLGAQWKLARMYAEGDGVKRNDYEAFKFFYEVVNMEVEAGSREETYVSDALVALADYYREGIPNSPVVADSTTAQDYYRRAATYYRNPQAQFELGQMFLKGEGGLKANAKLAGRWLKLAAENGHIAAQATLGQLLYHGGKVVRGLAMLTAALERASPSDRVWIGGLQEEAFSLASEADRRTAVELARDMVARNP